MYRDRQILILMVALLVSALFVVLIGLLYVRVQEQEDELDEKGVVLAENVGKLKLVDEQFTSYAKIAAAATDPRYESLYTSRYEELIPKYENLLGETLNLFPESRAEQELKEMEGAANRLFELEGQAFALDREGKDEEALALLESPEYERYKRLVSERLNSAFSALEASEAEREQQLRTHQFAL